MLTRLRLLLLGLVTCSAVIASSMVVACPFCDAPEPSLAEQLSNADAAILAQWVSAQPADREKQSFGETTYAVVQVVRQPGGDLTKDSKVVLDRFRPGKPGDLFLIMGTNNEGIEWGSPLEVTETSFNYITQSPGREVAASKRLAFFQKFLEYPDELISKDAYSEFAAAPYSDIAPLAHEFDPAKLRAWINSPETTPTRIGFYGMMLGLCGKAEDAEFLKAEISKPTTTYRLGLDGMMAGYVLLTGDPGIDFLVETKLKNAGKDHFADTYAAMQTLRFMWQYEPDRIGKDRLRKAMRTLIERSEFADLAITDLARWDDWEVMPRLVEMYDSPTFDNSQTKRSVIRYLLVLSRKKPAADDTALQGHVEQARKHLEALREKDPKTVKDAEKYFF